MSEKCVQEGWVFEGAATRYRALMVKTRDPVRRKMLEEMIACELSAANLTGSGGHEKTAVDL